MKTIILLGSTGSVGRNVLDIVRHFPDKFRIKAISASENVDLLAKQAREFSPSIVSIASDKLCRDLKSRIGRKVKVLSGMEGMEELASTPCDIVFIAISGVAALGPLIKAIEAGRTIALASKEPIVSAGEVIRKLMGKTSARLLPVDSEHSAIMQCMAARSTSDVRKLYITGSGGPLRNKKKREFDSLSIREVLEHPKWDMGPKITVDSATLMNKGLEVIEARWLFDIEPDRIDVIIHPEAIIHSMVEFVDGTVSANLFSPDMRFPILRALSFPDVYESKLPRVDFLVTNKLTFEKPDTDRFPALEAAFEALRLGGTVPSVLNASNEEAVKLFLNGKINFTRIIKIVEAVTRKHKRITNPTIDDIVDSENWAKEKVNEFTNNCTCTYSF